MATQVERVPNLDHIGAVRYQVDIDVDSDTTHATILRLVGKNKRVLELGCGPGHMSRILNERGCSVTAIEIDPIAAERASSFCDKVIVGDLDRLDLDCELDSARFDVIIAADVLEHLREPAAVLRSVKKRLQPDGCLIVSIPNVAHLSVRLALLSGRFPYAETGLLDRTHLRFFTRESLERLFDEAGIAIGHLHRTQAIPADPQAFEVPYDPASVPPAVLETLSRDPEASTYQFVVVGYPMPRASLDLIQQRMKLLAFDLEVAQRENAALREQLDRLSHLRVKEIAEVSERAQNMVNDLQFQAEQARQLRETEVAGIVADLQFQAEEARQLRETEVAGMVADLQFQVEEARKLRETEVAEIVADLQFQAEEARRLREAEVAEMAADLQFQAEEARQLHEAEVAEMISRTAKASADSGQRIVSLQDQIAQKERQIEELSSSRDRAVSEVSALRQERGERETRIAVLEAKAEALFAREKDLRDMLFEAHDQLIRRDEEIAATLATTLHRSAPLPTTTVEPAPRLPKPLVGKYLTYRQMIQRVRELVTAAAPPGATVLVISKGDEDLLHLAPCRGTHFPQREDGVYAGYYPADDDAAIRHLTELQQRGAEFLLIPETSLWWLKHYSKFAEHLNSHHERVIDEPEQCIMFRLTRMSAAKYTENLVTVPQPEPRVFGANVAGHIGSEKGVGEGLRSTLRVLRTANVPLALNNFIDPGSVNLDSEFTAFSDDNPYSVNLLHMNADELPTFVRERGPNYFKEHYNIGYWAWELSRFPEKWIDSFQYLDEIWVPSNFVLESVARSSPIPVITVPHSLPEKLSITADGRSRFDLPENKFLFLFMFDYMSILERKNPLGLIEAFRKAFKPADDAVLVIKSVHSESCPDEVNRIRSASHAINVKFVDGVLTKSETNTLLKLCDCYVSLHRSEGFGLTMAEAMSLGKPVIATGYSGNMDYMTPADSFLVDYKLVPLSEDYDPYEKGSVWAEPDVNHAAELMRLVYENRQKAAKVGKRAKAAIQQRLGAGTIGHIVRERLARLAALGKLSVPETVLQDPDLESGHPAEDPEYRALVHQIREVVKNSTPPGAMISVISKGDDELLKIAGRHGWHFPRQQDGTYAGFYPPDSEAAITHLNSVRGNDVRFFVIPRTAFWWLDHYAGFGAHLESQHRLIWRDQNCIVYKLSDLQGKATWRIRDRMRALSLR